MVNKAISGLAVAAAMLAVGQAQAALTPSGSVGGAPTGVSKANFDELVLGSGSQAVAVVPAGSLNGTMTVSFTPEGQVVQGASEGKYAPPFLSGGNGAGFGSPNQADGADATKYLTTGTSGSEVILSFSKPQRYLGLLWGSVDTYNTLTFYSAGGSVGSLTGSDVFKSPNGDQGVNGTIYVNINSSLAFDTVIARSSEYAFEFDNVAFNVTPVPEASTWPAGIAALGMLVASFLRYRKS
jgi:hypothetical protein